MTGRLPSYYRAAIVPVELRGGLCDLCRTPVAEEFQFCYQCSQQLIAHPDLAGVVTYAVKGRQSGTDMHRYKDQRPSPQALENVFLLLKHGLTHLRCAGQLLGTPVRAVTVMPSRSHYQAGTPSQFQRLCARTLPEDTPTVSLRPTQGSASDRRVHGDAFEVIVDHTDMSHVVLIDDTWVSGGTALSAVASLQKAGAHQVSVLVLARWLDPAYGATRDFLTLRSQVPGWRQPQDVCPFTLDGSCPASG
jgi:hypothetical protein